MRILLTGGSGQIGTEFRQRAAVEWEVFAPGRTSTDLTNPDSIRAAVRSQSFDVVINAGAYTAVDRAEDEVELAWQINALAPSVLAEATAGAGIPLVQLSTDYVFDGKKIGAYVEDDAVGPLGVYGASKEAGEQTVRLGNPRHIILRTAWVVSPFGSNFVKTMLRLGAERSHLRVVCDQRGCPTSAADISLALIAMLPRLLEEKSPTGTYHFVNDGEASWYNLAQFIFSSAQKRGIRVPFIEAIPTDQYPTRARRPANSRLSTTKLRRDFGITPRPWTSAIEDVVEALLLPAEKE